MSTYLVFPIATTPEENNKEVNEHNFTVSVSPPFPFLRLQQDYQQFPSFRRHREMAKPFTK
jgi:hypothetical protein